MSILLNRRVRGLQCLLWGLASFGLLTGIILFAGSWISSSSLVEGLFWGIVFAAIGAPLLSIPPLLGLLVCKLMKKPAPLWVLFLHLPLSLALLGMALAQNRDPFDLVKVTVPAGSQPLAGYFNTGRGYYYNLAYRVPPLEFDKYVQENGYEGIEVRGEKPIELSRHLPRRFKTDPALTLKRMYHRRGRDDHDYPSWLYTNAERDFLIIEGSTK